MMKISQARSGPMARVLLVEDDADLRLLYLLELGREGYDVVGADCGAEALYLLEKEKIDTVVLDLRLPDFHGLQLLEEMLARQHDLHVIINSAYDHFREDFHSWGADAYVVKSSDLSPLKRALARVAPLSKLFLEMRESAVLV
jgi:DNA-binding NtrC family response regulator